MSRFVTNERGNNTTISAEAGRMINGKPSVCINIEYEDHGTSHGIHIDKRDAEELRGWLDDWLNGDIEEEASHIDERCASHCEKQAAACCKAADILERLPRTADEECVVPGVGQRVFVLPDARYWETVSPDSESVEDVELVRADRESGTDRIMYGVLFGNAIDMDFYTGPIYAHRSNAEKEREGE